MIRNDAVCVRQILNLRKDLQIIRQAVPQTADRRISDHRRILRVDAFLAMIAGMGDTAMIRYRKP